MRGKWEREARDLEAFMPGLCLYTVYYVYFATLRCHKCDIGSNDVANLCRMTGFKNTLV